MSEMQQLQTELLTLRTENQQLHGDYVTLFAEKQGLQNQLPSLLQHNQTLQEQRTVTCTPQFVARPTRCYNSRARADVR